jgi:RNA polymerase sigma-70 factor (ECF subfamily)
MTETVHHLVIAELPALLPRLWRYALVLSGSRTKAEDLVQSACLRALERSAQFTPGTRLDHWVLAILRSIWFNELRAQRIREGQGFVDAAEVLVSDGARQAETNILAAEVLTEVMALPEAQRETVLLVYVEGFSYGEAAGLLNIPVGTVMSRLAAARGKLSRLNAGDPAPEGSVAGGAP